METKDSTIKSSVSEIEKQDKIDTSKIKPMSNDHVNINNGNKLNDNEIMDFDDMLPYVGEFGFYQRMMFLFMIPISFFVVFVYFGQIFITLVPANYWCRVPELRNLTVEQRMALSIPPAGENDDAVTSGYSRCSMYKINYTEILQDKTITVADPSWPTQKCQYGWEYNFTEIPYETIATQNNWICDNAALPTIAQSVFFIGAIFGGLIFGWIADHYGRIPAIVSANLIACIAGIGTAFTNNFWQFTLTRFLVGFAFDNCFSMMYILLLEYVGLKWRTFVANMSIAIFFTFASCLLPWIAYFLADWQNTALAISVPLALAILTPWLVPESARWLVSQGQIDRANEIMKKIGEINGKIVPENIYKRFKDSCEQTRRKEIEGKFHSAFDLFKSPRLRKVTLLLTIIWMIISLVFDGHVRNVDNLGLDVFITFTIAAVTELPADTFLTLVLDRWGRRWLACGSMVISGFFSIWACAVSSNIYSASLAMMGRFCVNISYNIGLQYAAELLPTVVRAQGVAFIHIMGCVANIMAPFIVYLAVISPILPLLLLGILGVIGGLLALLLPETLDHELPQTLQDGEDFGKDQGFWDMPCFMKKADDDEKPGFIRQYPAGSERKSGRLSLRGEVLRSSMIQRSSLRSRKNTTNIPITVMKL